MGPAAGEVDPGLESDGTAAARLAEPYGAAHRGQAGRLRPAIRMTRKCGSAVSFFRSVLLPLVIVALFALALFAVSARIWLPGDMAAPAPIG